MNTFTLSYNPLGSKLTANQLLGWIKASRNIGGWYSPFIGTYFLKSPFSLTVLLDEFNAAFDGEHYVLTHVNASFVGGIQPQFIWNWINTGDIMLPTGK